MSTEVYNYVQTILGCCALTGLGMAAVYFVAAAVGWRSPHRNRRLLRSALWLAVFPICAAITYLILFYVYLPTVAREAQRERGIQQAGSSVVQVNDPAPSFTLTDTEGRAFALDDCRGKVVIVNFFATWCGPCRMELPHLQKLWNKYHDNHRFALIVVGREESTETINEFRMKQDYQFPMAADPDGAVYALYAEQLIPRTYLIGPDGKICFASTGFDEQEFATLKKEVARQLHSLP